MRKRRTTRPPFGIPTQTTLLRMPDGWRYSFLTAAGGTVCGRLAELPSEAGPGQAQRAAAAMVAALARDFHGVDVEVDWRRTGDSYTGTVRPARPEPAPGEGSRTRRGEEPRG
ncbi:hypothetical protein [Streptomyces melanogenes]|uniref:hypothetical protein n=1 Tax=Streptomyces melanogenes TaxID=67326 RepID=UPI0037BAF989